MNNLNAKQWKGLYEYLESCKTEKELADIYNQLNNVSFSRDKIVSMSNNPDLDLKGHLALVVFDTLSNHPSAISETKISIGNQVFDLKDVQRNKFLDSLKLADMHITRSLPSQIVAFERELGYPDIVNIARGQKIELSDRESHIIINCVSKPVAFIASEGNYVNLEDVMNSDLDAFNLISDMVSKVFIEEQLTLDMN